MHHKSMLPSPLFGKIVGAGLAPAQMELSEIGMIAYKQWIEIPKRFDNIELDEFVIMPNQIHGIIVIYNPEPSFGQPQGLPLRKTLGEIVGAYKSLAAAECLKIYKNNNIIMGKLWQRNVDEHIIRNEESYIKIAQYIISSPTKWELDSLYIKETR